MSGGRGAVARLTGLAALGLLVAAGLGLATTSVTSQTVGLSGEGASVSEELVASRQAASNRARDAARRDRRQRERDTVSEAGLPAVEGLEKFSWRGTPPLTRRQPRVAADRVFVLGDAAGYVEPFTGEGIAWALTSGASVVKLVRRAVRQWDPSLIREWEAIYRKVVAKCQRICRGVAYLVKKPAWVHAAALVLSLQPRLVKPVVRHINAPYFLT